MSRPLKGVFGGHVLLATFVDGLDFGDISGCCVGQQKAFDIIWQLWHCIAILTIVIPEAIDLINDCFDHFTYSTVSISSNMLQMIRHTVLMRPGSLHRSENIVIVRHTPYASLRRVGKLALRGSRGAVRGLGFSVGQCM